MARRGLVVALAVIAAWVCTAGPASAAVLQTPGGDPYVGPLNANLQGDFTVSSSVATVTCNDSVGFGQVSGAGSLTTPGLATIDGISYGSGANQQCPVDVIARDLPWSITADWTSDNTSGDPNGTFTVSNVRVTLVLDASNSCDYVGDFAGSAFSTNRVQTEVLNSTNTASGRTEMRFQEEPFRLLSGAPICPATGTANGTYLLTGADGVDLQLRGTAAPVPNKTVNVRTVSGVVEVKQPGAAGFTVLSGPKQIPVGSQIDTTAGRVELSSASDLNGGVRTGEFYDGLFTVKQKRPKGKKKGKGRPPITTLLKLVPNAGCGNGQARGKGKGNGLWGNEKGGGHSSQGKSGSASTRGTIWFVGDRCDGSTLARVEEGKVKFRDFVLDKTITLNAGDSYVAGGD